ncbi:muconolactone Delta-isomerase [Nocardia nova]|uniref:muconolactone Delta-isomerase n=1 Tax=Nocardia nova TaxID=37330 RepID=UPI0033F35507
MNYLVHVSVHPPQGMARDDWQGLMQAESDYGIEMRRQGHLIEIWRIPGTYQGYSLWDVAGHDEMHSLLAAAPLFAHVDFTVTPLAMHPSTQRWNELIA